jgi:hypothetical protein
VIVGNAGELAWKKNRRTRKRGYNASSRLVHHDYYYCGRAPWRQSNSVVLRFLASFARDYEKGIIVRLSVF